MAVKSSVHEMNEVWGWFIDEINLLPSAQSLRVHHDKTMRIIKQKDLLILFLLYFRHREYISFSFSFLSIKVSIFTFIITQVTIYLMFIEFLFFPPSNK